MKAQEFIIEGLRDPKDNPCWKGYKPVGTKQKGGRTVPNCVPKEGIEEQADWREASAKSNLQPGVPVMIWLGPRNQNPPRDDKKYWERGVVMDSPEWIDGQWRVLVKTDTKSQWPINPERVFVLKKDVAEEYNAEYDDEAGMADNNLETLERAIQGIDDLIHPGDNLPEWCQEKIAIAKSMLVNVWDYMRSEEDRGAVAEGGFFDPDKPNIGDTVQHKFNKAVGKVKKIGTQDDKTWIYFKDNATGDINYGEWKKHVFPVKTKEVEEDWQKANRKDKTPGMSKKAVAAYRREHPGSKLQTAVTTKPSKLKKGSKASKRRKSYCARSKGQMDMHNIDCSKTPDKAICKSRRRWNCE